VLCIGCVSPPAPPAALEDGKSVWRRVETDHFVVESNLSNDRKLLRIASDFETLWHAFASVPVLGMRPPKKKPLVVVLRGENEYRYFAGERTTAFFLDGTVLGPLILLPASGRAFEETVIKHELAHFVISGSIANPPQWLGEGLAQVMETATYDTGAGRILFGIHSPGRVYDAAHALPASSFTGTWPTGLTTDELRAYYARSWLLVHYLIDFELQPFLDFFVRVRNGEDWHAAWTEDIPLPRDGIDDALKRYHERAKYGLWTVDAYLPDMDAFQPSAVSPADALALRAVLHAYSPNPARGQAQNLEAADRDMQAARDLDSNSARVRMLSAALEAARK
jgi:hypothetical protein